MLYNMLALLGLKQRASNPYRYFYADSIVTSRAFPIVVEAWLYLLDTNAVDPNDCPVKINGLVTSYTEISHKSQKVIYAMHNDDLVGCIVISINNNIVLIYVKQRYRGKGIEDAMLKQLSNI